MEGDNDNGNENYSIIASIAALTASMAVAGFVYMHSLHSNLLEKQFSNVERLVIAENVASAADSSDDENLSWQEIVKLGSDLNCKDNLESDFLAYDDLTLDDLARIDKQPQYMEEFPSVDIRIEDESKKCILALDSVGQDQEVYFKVPIKQARAYIKAHRKM